MLRRMPMRTMEQIRVTQILDFFKPPYLVDWYIKVGKREARRLGTVAKKIGTRVHDLIEQDPTKGS